MFGSATPPRQMVSLFAARDSTATLLAATESFRPFGAVCGRFEGLQASFAVATSGSSAGHHDRRSHVDALKKIHHILIVHADAARGYEAADRVWPICSMDRIFAARQRQGSNPHRIARRSSGNHPRNVG